MQKFLSLWIVWIVLAAVAGLFFGGIDYFFSAPVPDTVDDEWADFRICQMSVFGLMCLHDRSEFLAIYPFLSTLLAAITYPIFRAVIGSFKVIFFSNDTDREKGA